MTTLDVHVLRVFTDDADDFGNELAVVFDAAALGTQLGIRLTAQLGFSETVFVDDTDLARIRIFTPVRELPLAGHPAVGAVWALTRQTGRTPEVLRPRLAAEVPAWTDPDGPTWIRGRLEDAPDWTFVRLDDARAVEALPVPPGPDCGHHQFWAWADEGAGLVRSRGFAPAMGIAEDEATGSAALRLAHSLGRAITIRQGRGSVLRARPAAEPGWAEIGGRVAADGRRTVTVTVDVDVQP